MTMLPGLPGSIMVIYRRPRIQFHLLVDNQPLHQSSMRNTVKRFSVVAEHTDNILFPV